MATTKRGKFEAYFEEMSIRMDQSSRDGKIICSTATMSGILKRMSQFAKELGK